MHVSREAFDAHVHAKTLQPAARRVQEVLQTRTELMSVFPDARQCGHCHYGPIIHEHCGDLTTHHGQVLSGSSTPLDNACPRCGWFRPSINEWPRWDPNRLTAEDVAAAPSAHVDGTGEETEE